MNDINISFKNNMQNNFSEVPLDELPLTMAYVPFQRLSEVYADEKALKNGTLFPDIDKPLVLRGSAK